MANIKKILFATDLSKQTEKLIPHVKYWVSKFRAHLFIVTVIQPPPDEFLVYQDLIDISIDDYEKKLFQATEERLSMLADSEFSQVEKLEKAVLKGVIHEELLRFAKEKGADLIIMGSATKEGLAEKMFGRTANKIISNAICPVLTINPFKID